MDQLTNDKDPKQDTVNLLIIAISTAIVLVFVKRTFWVADDFVYMQILSKSDLSWNLLTQSYNQHVVPLFIFSWWFVYKISNGNYIYAEIIMTAGYIYLCISFLSLIKLFHLTSRQTHFLLIMFCTSLLIIHNFLWWAAFLSFLLPIILIINFTKHSIKFKESHKKIDFALGLIFYIASTLYFEKMAIYSIFILIFVLFYDNYNLNYKKSISTLKEMKYYWATIFIWTIFIAYLYLASNSLSQTQGRPTILKMVMYCKFIYTKYFTPRVFGLDPGYFNILGNQRITQIFSVVIILFALLLIIKLKKFYAFFLLYLLFFVAVNESVVAYGRLNSYGYTLGNEIRYHLDSYFMFMLVLALTLKYVNSKDVKLFKSKFYKIALMVLLALVVLFNLRTLNADSYNFITYYAKTFHQNLKSARDKTIVNTMINERYIDIGNREDNQLSSIQNLLHLNIKTTDIGDTIMLPSGKTLNLSRLSKLKTTPIQTNELCAATNNISTVLESPQVSEYIAFTLLGDVNNLDYITVTDHNKTTKSYTFDDRESDAKSFAFSTLYLFDKGELSIGFYFDEPSNNCIEDISLIDRINFRTKI